METARRICLRLRMLAMSVHLKRLESSGSRSALDSDSPTSRGTVRAYLKLPEELMDDIMQFLQPIL